MLVSMVRPLGGGGAGGVGGGVSHPRHTAGPAVDHTCEPRGDRCRTATPSVAHPGRLVLISSRLCRISCYVQGRTEGMIMTNPPVRLKALLRERHWQTYRTFNAEYDKAARKVDPVLVGKGPSRAQLHRWTSGEVKGLPYPDHCRVLEKMFLGWTAEQLFQHVDDDQAEVSTSPPAAERDGAEPLVNEADDS